MVDGTEDDGRRLYTFVIDQNRVTEGHIFSGSPAFVYLNIGIEMSAGSRFHRSYLFAGNLWVVFFE